MNAERNLGFLRNRWEQVKRELSSWSVWHFLIDFALAIALTAIIGWLAKMPLGLQLTLGGSLLAIITSAMALLRNASQEFARKKSAGQLGRRVADKSQRVQYAKEMIQQRIDTVVSTLHDASIWTQETGILLREVFGENAECEFCQHLEDLADSDEEEAKVKVRQAKAYLEGRLVRLHEGEIRTY